MAKKRTDTLHQRERALLAKFRVRVASDPDEDPAHREAAKRLLQMPTDPFTGASEAIGTLLDDGLAALRAVVDGRAVLVTPAPEPDTEDDEPDLAIQPAVACTNDEPSQQDPAPAPAAVVPEPPSPFNLRPGSPEGDANAALNGWKRVDTSQPRSGWAGLADGLWAGRQGRRR